jgi:hypothetical protein
MRHRATILLSGIAALALVAASAQAIELNVGIGGGNDPAVNVKAGVGNTNATVNSTTGGASTGSVTATVSNGSNNALPNSLSANASIDLDDVTDGGRVTADLNGDGVIDDNDTAMAKLDINGDGVLNFLDDANDDGVLNDADLDALVSIGKEEAEGAVTFGLGGETSGTASVGIGGLPPGDVDLGKVIGDIELPQLPSIEIGSIGIGEIPGPGETPPPGIIPDPGVNPGPVPGVTDRDLSNTFRNLNDDDIADLKIKCADVMANPNAFDAATVAVCRVLASL